jgi:hypothetical protein
MIGVSMNDQGANVDLRQFLAKVGFHIGVNLVAVEFTPNGRGWSVIGEYGAVATGGERGSASIDLPGRKLATSKSPRMLEPFEIDFLRQDLKAILAFSGGPEPIASDPRCFTYARQGGLPFLYGVSTPEGACLLPAHRRRRLVQVTCTY